VSKALLGKLAEIDVASLALGDQVEQKWLPLTGIVYDSKSDVVEMTLEELDRMISRPRDIAVQAETIGLASIEVTNADGVIADREAAQSPLASTAVGKLVLLAPTAGSETGWRFQHDQALPAKANILVVVRAAFPPALLRILGIHLEDGDAAGYGLTVVKVNEARDQGASLLLRRRVRSSQWR
jgi:hypothetical protein